MAVIKVVEIMCNSKQSWEHATTEGISKVSKTVKNIKSAFVQSHSVSVEDGEVKDFRVNLKISFEVD